MYLWEHNGHMFLREGKSHFLAQKKTWKKAPTDPFSCWNVINNNDNKMITFAKFQQESFATVACRMLNGVGQIDAIALNPLDDNKMITKW